MEISDWCPRRAVALFTIRWLVSMFRLFSLYRHGHSHKYVDNIMKANDLVSKSISRMREMEQSLKDNPRVDGVAAVPCISLMSALVDVLEINVDDKALFAEARNLCKVLAEVDPVRRKYWRKRQSALMDKIDT